MQSPTQILKKTWHQYTSHWKLFSLVYLVPALISAVVLLPFMLYAGVIEEERFSVAIAALFLTGIILLVTVNILMAIAMLKAVSDPLHTTVRSAYSFAKGYFWAYLFVSILVGIIVTLGLFALIIPGIYFAVRYAFSIYALVFEDKRGMDALRASAEYVKDRWWGVFGRFLFMGLISFVISALFGVTALIISGNNEIVQEIVVQLANFILVPFAVVYTYILYTDVRNSAVPSATNPPTTTPTPQDTPGQPIASSAEPQPTEDSDSTEPKAEKPQVGYGKQ